MVRNKTTITKINKTLKQELNHIAVNTRLLLPGGVEGIGRFSIEILKRLVKDHPNTQFSFFFDRAYDEKYIFGPNVKPYVLFPQARHPFLFLWYFELSVSRKLRQLKPDVFFSPDGYLSLRSSVPQVPVFHDLAFEHFPEDVKKMEAWHYRRYFPRFARKAARIITVSEYTKKDVLERYQVDADKIDVVYNACADHFQPLESSEYPEIREQFSAGKPYFHCVSAIQPRKNLDNLISAYDQFKSETGAEHQLLIVGRKAWNFEKVIHSYTQSPYKDQIHFTGFVSDEDLNRINNASAGLVYVPYFEGFGLPIVEAMKCGTPVITSNVSSMPEVAGEAALIVDPRETGAIAGAMRRLYAEPELADQLVHKGNERRLTFSWDSSAEKVWNVLAKV